MKRKKSSSTIIYQSKTGAIELKKEIDTVWATQEDIADIFNIDRTAITKHIRNILKDKELDADSVCAKMARTAEDGKVYQVQFYNLDIILAVGYRASSTKAIAFCQWATRTLKSHITKGYTLNKQRIKANYESFIKAIDDVKSLLPSHINVDHQSVLELIKFIP